MKIGIISMQRVENYGSILQGYGLKKTLEENGNEVVFVDIEKSQKAVTPQDSKVNRILSKLKLVDRYFVRRLKDKKKNILLSDILLTSQRKLLGLVDETMTSDGCDAVVIGSDEIFNCDSKSVWGVTRQRFGKINNVKTVVSYAASCGYTSINDIDDEDKLIIKESLNSLAGISVRDINTLKFIEYFTDKKTSQNLDPVLIYDFKEELECGMKEGTPDYSYMVVYAYHNRIDSKEEIAAIKKYAKKYHLRTIAIGGSLPWCDEFALPSPFQVLAYFKNANCIVTDTFHGTVIASKYNKPLAVLVRDSNKNKLVDLCERLCITKHIVTDTSKLEEILNCEDDYADCNKVIENGKLMAIQYFKDCHLR